jgi:hypothetical protein
VEQELDNNRQHLVPDQEVTVKDIGKTVQESIGNCGFPEK